MRTKIRFTTILLLIITFFTSCDEKEPPVLYGHINGIVYEEGTTTSIQGVTIILSPSGTTKTTGSDGKFEFKNLEAKQYTLQASKGGFVDNTKTVTVNISEDTKVDISLVSSTPTITPAFTQHSASATAGNVVLNIQSNTNWNAGSSEAWLTLSPATGTNNGQITLTWAENTTSANRSAKVMLTGTNVSSQEITITQNGTGAILSISPITKDISAIIGSFTVNVTSNLDWTVSSNQTWLTLSTLVGNGDASITANYEANPTVGERAASLTFSGAGINDQTVTVTQAAGAAVLNINPSSQTVIVTGGTTSFEVSSNVNWTATSDQSWCVLTNNSGTGSGTISVNVSEENTAEENREAQITVSAADVDDKIISIIQEGTNYYISITAPVSGEGILVGVNYEITWNDNIAEDVKIELWKDASFHSNIDVSTSNNGTYNWIPPTSLIYATGFK